MHTFVSWIFALHPSSLSGVAPSFCVLLCNLTFHCIRRPLCSYTAPLWYVMCCLTFIRMCSSFTSTKACAKNGNWGGKKSHDPTSALTMQKPWVTEFRALLGSLLFCLAKHFQHSQLPFLYRNQTLSHQSADCREQRWDWKWGDSWTLFSSCPRATSLTEDTIQLVAEVLPSPTVQTELK